MTLRPDDQRPRVTAGKLNRMVTLVLDAEEAGRDALNNPIMGEPVRLVVAASKEDVSDRERMAAAEQSAEVTTRFRIRWNARVSGVHAGHHVELDGVVYEISGVKEIGRREGLEITTARRADR